MASRLSFALVALSLLAPSCHALQPYNGPAPELPDRSPFGFGAAATGGGTPTANNTYLVDNMPDLRAVLKMESPRTVYVKGEIKGSEINETTTGDCQFYIDTSNNPNFNFTLYVQAMNETYMDQIKAASEAGEQFEGQNATELLSLLDHQNGWRSQVQNVQKSWESIDAAGNLTLIGWDSSTYLHGVNLNFNSRSNIIMRNIRISSPRDCFPAPETYPSSWNARYDAVSMVSSHTVWFDGNIFEDGPTAVAPDDFLYGWKVDRYDGLFDAEDGTDNVTFSHNVIANHHKSLLWGGGNKEADRDIGKMKFTVYANHFVNSMSRNPLMRFGTFYIVGNVFENRAERAPLFPDSSVSNTSALTTRADSNATYAPDFQYNMGIYNGSTVLVAANAFVQTGSFASDSSRIFSFSDLATPAAPARLCSPADTNSSLAGVFATKSTFNGAPIDLDANARTTWDFFLESENDGAEFVAGGFVQGCAGLAAQDVPVAFEDGAEVVAYVGVNAGVVGRAGP
ncbi:putative pectate lyase protein [Neofusicoccum parvum UCRNP2]|uniref:Putative pectate lyase protein n=1 Tax=Botryosphaeria parva (strain UCR-NP2) TaxID=1287680 RepID=R1FVU2_BOTPV|nr:putative pectate lyase protein [Neofusicoccum parvum UCRNP2]